LDIPADAVEAFLNRRALKALRRRLGEGERVHKVVQGDRHGTRGLLAATGTTLYWIEERPLRRALVEVMPIERVDSIHVRTQDRRTRVRLIGDGDAWTLEDVVARSADALEAFVRARLRGDPVTSFEVDEEETARAAEERRLRRVGTLESKGRLSRREAEWFRGR